MSSFNSAAATFILLMSPIAPQSGDSSWMMELHTALSVEPAGVLQPPAASLNVPGPANVASDISGNGPLVQPLAASNGGAGVPPLNPAAVAGMSTAPGDGRLISAIK